MCIICSVIKLCNLPLSLIMELSKSIINQTNINILEIARTILVWTKLDQVNHYFDLILIIISIN